MERQPPLLVRPRRNSRSKQLAEYGPNLGYKASILLNHSLATLPIHHRRCKKAAASSGFFVDSALA